MRDVLVAAVARATDRTIPISVRFTFRSCNPIAREIAHGGRDTDALETQRFHDSLDRYTFASLLTRARRKRNVQLLREVHLKSKVVNQFQAAAGDANWKLALVSMDSRGGQGTEPCDSSKSHALPQDSSEQARSGSGIPTSGSGGNVARLPLVKAADNRTMSAEV